MHVTGVCKTRRAGTEAPVAGVNYILHVPVNVYIWSDIATVSLV